MSRIIKRISIATALGILLCVFTYSNYGGDNKEVVVYSGEEAGSGVNYSAEDLDEARGLCRHLGRTYTCNDTLWFDYTMSGIEFELCGESCDVTLVSDYPDEDMYHAYVGIVIGDNEELRQRIEISQSTQTFSIKNPNGESPSKIQLVKLSEGKRGTVGIKSVTLPQNVVIKKTQHKEQLIEFIGDSITCGMGNEGIYGDKFRTSHENGYMSYAAITGRILNADVSLISYSGIALTRREEEVRNFGIAELYKYSRPVPEWGELNSNCIWEPVREPDIIVINIGTNDVPILEEKKGKESFEQDYREFLMDLLVWYPHARIICSIGPMNLAPAEIIMQVVESMESDRVGFLEFGAGIVNGMGTDEHPSIATHINMSERLCDAINKMDGS